MAHNVLRSAIMLTLRSSKGSLREFQYPMLSFKPTFGRCLPDVVEKPSDYGLFNYTSGRFLYNEQLRLSERKLVFNFEALCHTVAEIFKSDVQQITSVRKIGEGGSFRAFAFEFRDGQTVIARLPYPSLRPLERGVSSEAATIEYLHLHGFPVPRVLSWTASSDNEVGSAYLILERATGTELSKEWFTMEMKPRARTITSIVEFEKKLSDLVLPAYGSIYFKDDPSIVHEKTIDTDTDSVGQNFVMGPSAEHLWYYSERDRLGISPGPWRTPADLINAVVDREIAWMEQFAKPRQPRDSFFFQEPDMEPSDPQVHIDALHKFRKMSLALIPNDKYLTRPLLRHPDLSPNNIFVTGTDVTSVIDWQHATSLPLYVQALIPAHFQFYGDPMAGMVAKPTLPSNFDSLTAAEQQVALETYRRRQCHVFYSASVGARNIDFFWAMNDPTVVLRGKLFDHGRSPWEGNNATLREDLLMCVDSWQDFHKPQHHRQEAEDGDKDKRRNGAVNAAADEEEEETEANMEVTNIPPCPIHFTDTERAEISALARRATAAEEDAELAMEGIGISSDGWVAHEHYDRARRQEEDLKKFMLERAEGGEGRRFIVEKWPYLDHEEVA